MSERQNPFTVPQAPRATAGWHEHDKLVQEYKDRQRAKKNRERRWEGAKVEDARVIVLGPQQVQDVLASLNLSQIPADGDYLLRSGAKFSVGRKGTRCVIYGYHHDGSDVRQVVEWIRNGEPISA